MRSRYDFMKEGTVLDPEDSSLYPDVLSLNFNNFTATGKPYIVELDAGNIEHIWALVYDYYGTAEYDDMVLSLNGVAHKNLLKEGDILLIPSLEDIETSFRRVGE